MNGTFVRFRNGAEVHVLREEMLLEGSGRVSFGRSFDELPAEVIDFTRDAPFDLSALRGAVTVCLVPSRVAPDPRRRNAEAQPPLVKALQRRPMSDAEDGCPRRALS